jgi:hypothetical protein
MAFDGCSLAERLRSHAVTVLMAMTVLVCSHSPAAPAVHPEQEPPLIGQPLELPVRGVAVWDTVQIVAYRPRLFRLNRSTSQGARTDSAAAERSLAFSAMSHFQTHERPRISRVVFGAGQMAGRAGALSGVGLVGGLWGEKTAGYLIGAGAVLGAILGGTVGADDPSISIGIDTRPLDQRPEGPYPFPGRNH